LCQYDYPREILKNDNDETPLHSAILNGNIHLLEELLFLDVDHTALHYSVLADQYEAVEKLLELGCSPLSINQRGFTPMMVAKQLKRERIYTLLTQYDSKTIPSSRRAAKRTKSSPTSNGFGFLKRYFGSS